MLDGTNAVEGAFIHLHSQQRSRSSALPTEESSEHEKPTPRKSTSIYSIAT